MYFSFAQHMRCTLLTVRSTLGFSFSLFAMIGCQPDIQTNANQTCVPFSQSSFTQISDYSFETVFENGNCVGAMLGANAELYSTANVRIDNEYAGDLSISGSALISSVTDSHLEAGFAVSNNSGETICSISFETTKFYGAQNQLIFSAGPTGVITPLYNSTQNFPGYCLNPGQRGWARKTAWAQISIGPSQNVSTVELGRVTYVIPGSDFQPYHEESTNQNLFVPAQLEYDEETLVLSVIYTGESQYRYPDKLVVIYTDINGFYLDYTEWTADLLTPRYVVPGQTLRFEIPVLEAQSPRGRAWGIYVVIN